MNIQVKCPCCHQRLFDLDEDTEGTISIKCQRRKAYLAAHPLCEQCMKEGRYTQATVVDHIVPHRGDPALFWDPSNWQVLCKQCHDKKTGREDSNPTYHY